MDVLGTPGVFVQPRPRPTGSPALRTDVAGFIGFEPRCRPRAAVVAPADASHRFAVDLSAFQVRIRGRKTRVPGADPAQGLTLSSGPGCPIADGQGLAYAVVAWLDQGQASAAEAASPVPVTRLAVIPGLVRLQPAIPAADDAVVAAALPLAWGWLRLADVVVRRSAGVVLTCVHPALPPARLEDWRDWLLAFGEAVDDGTLLAGAVQLFFLNGGGRCHVTTVRHPEFADGEEVENARYDLIGVAGSGEAEATGLARLLLIDEVAIVDVPDLHTRRRTVTDHTVLLPAPGSDACFHPCPVTGSITAQVPATDEADEPLWAGLDVVFATQRDLLALAITARGTVELLLTPPRHRDAASGRFRPPAPDEASDWRDRFDALVKTMGFAEDAQMSVGALYWPWLQVQVVVDGVVADTPPTAIAAGILARRDLARGPFVAPANETLRGVVGVSWPVDDEVQRALYEPDPDTNGFLRPAVNVLRPFPGLGIQAWGSRTLATDRWLRHLPIRRGLGAIIRMARRSLEPLVFEPNTPLLWLRTTHALVNTLMPLFESGVLLGDRPDQAFQVRCDATVNPPESIAEGRLIAEVSVAIAAPAEYLVVRIGRIDGAIQVLE